MKNGWKSRLIKRVEEDERSLRALSLAGGFGAGYVHSIVKDGKDPTVTHFLDLCRVLDVSPFEILGGFEITPDQEEFLRLLNTADEEVQTAVLLFLERGRKDEEIAKPPIASKDRRQTKQK